MKFFMYLQLLTTLAVLLKSAAATVIEDCPDVELISRDEWGAKLPKDVTSMQLPVSYVFIHHTAMGECFDLSSCIEEVKKVQDLHMETNNWSDIGYNFLVGEDGRVYEARGWNRTGAHTKYYNRVAIAVSVLGNFNDRIPNQAALEAVDNILKCGVRKGYIDPKYELFGHRDVRVTDCPGNAFYNLIKQWEHYSFNYPILHLGPSKGSASKYGDLAKLMAMATSGFILVVFLGL